MTPWNFKRNLAYQPAKNPRYNINCFDVNTMQIFPNWCPLYIPPWLVHFNVNIVTVLHSTYARKFILKCSSHRGMYDGHQFGKISIMCKQWMTGNADFWLVGRLGFSWNFKVSQWINLNESFTHCCILHHRNYVTRFKRNSVEPF